MNKRISFNESDAAHLYELAYSHFQDCYQCQMIKQRLEQFIGTSEINFVKKQLKKHPYDKK